MGAELYKGLWRRNDSTGVDGIRLDTNFTEISDRVGPVNWTASTDPAATDDSAHGYFIGSKWLNTSTTPKRLFVCVSDSAGAAVWQLVTPKEKDFVQAVPAATWSLSHGFNTYPNVIIRDSLNRVIFGDVSYPDANTVQVDFGGAFSGTAKVHL